MRLTKTFNINSNDQQNIAIRINIEVMTTNKINLGGV